MCRGACPGAEMNAVQLLSQKSPGSPVYSSAGYGGNVTAAEMPAAHARRDDEVFCEGGQGGSSMFDPYQ